MSSNSTQKKRLFLAELARNGGRVPAAADAAEIGRSTPHKWGERDSKFRDDMREAIDRATEVLEQEAIRRAFRGVKEPVYQGGQLVGYIRKYSDTVLIFLLKGRKPEVYKDRMHSEHTGANGKPIEVLSSDPKMLTDEQLAAIALQGLQTQQKG